MPRIALGCGGLLRGNAPAEATKVVHAALDVGINLLDTADVYQDGENERLVGRAVRGRRDRYIVATKFRYSTRAPGGSRRSVRLAVEASLRRLGTDYIDIYQLHAPDPSTPFEETAGALQDLVREGKVLYYGICNVEPWQAVDAHHIAQRYSGPALVSVQAQMNIVDPSALFALRPVASKFGLGLLAASPLARGLLGGAYSWDDPPPAGHPLLSPKGIGYWDAGGRRITERLRGVADDLSTKPAYLALQTLLAFPEVSSALVGASCVAQVRDIGHLPFDAVDKRTAMDILNSRGSLRHESEANPVPSPPLGG